MDVSQRVGFAEEDIAVVFLLRIGLWTYLLLGLDETALIEAITRSVPMERCQDMGPSYFVSVAFGRRTDATAVDRLALL